VERALEAVCAAAVVGKSNLSETDTD
jgi:hypothetical protein